MSKENLSITYHNNSDNISLPKWPAIVVKGDKISPELAAEIIIKTDTSLPNFEYASNNHEFEKELNDIFGVPYKIQLDHKDYQSHFEKMNNLRKKLNVLPLYYLNNDRILSSYIGGPSGWCNWNGEIFINNINIGKWPDVQDVAEDWALISKTFPELNLRCQLYNGEHCEDNVKPIVEFIVANEHVDVDIVNEKTKPLSELGDLNTIDVILMIGDIRREIGLSKHDLINKLHAIYGDNIPQYGDNND